MKKILECVIFCIVGVGILLLLTSLIKTIWGDYAAGAAYLSFILGLFALFKISVNYSWGKRLGELKEFEFKSILKTINSTFIFVYAISLWVGTDSLVKMVVHDFAKLPSVAGLILLYIPVYIGYAIQRKKIGRECVHSETAKKSEVKENLATFDFADKKKLIKNELVSEGSGQPVKSKVKAEAVKVKARDVVISIILAVGTYSVQASEGTSVNKIGFYFFLTCAIGLSFVFIKQKAKTAK